MSLRLLPVRGGGKSVTLGGTESISLHAAPSVDGTEAEESAFFEADVSAGTALVTWLGAEGCARIFRKGGLSIPDILEAGVEETLGIGDKIDVAACSLEEASTAPQSRSTWMLTASQRPAAGQATQPVLALPSLADVYTAERESGPEAETEPTANTSEQADAAVTLTFQSTAKHVTEGSRSAPALL